VTKKQPKTSHFFVYSRRATRDPHDSWHGDRGGPCHFRFPLKFIDPMTSFAARGEKPILTTGLLSKRTSRRPAGKNLGSFITVIFFAVFDVSLNNGSTVNDTSKTAKII